ncbi:hypothetical protein L1887_54404 [Cichorium endivia]|nr:hypothetical protein L1887_54404 [Cichorium endivia]
MITLGLVAESQFRRATLGASGTLSPLDPASRKDAGSRAMCSKHCPTSSHSSVPRKDWRARARENYRHLPLGGGGRVEFKAGLRRLTASASAGSWLLPSVSQQRWTSKCPKHAIGAADGVRGCTGKVPSRASLVSVSAPTLSTRPALHTNAHGPGSAQRISSNAVSTPGERFWRC